MGEDYCPKCDGEDIEASSSVGSDTWEYECNECGHKWTVVILKTATIKK